MSRKAIVTYRPKAAFDEEIAAARDVYAIHEAKREIKFVDGSVVRVFDSNRPEQMRGLRFDKVVIDELIEDPELLSVLACISTPRGVSRV